MNKTININLNETIGTPNPKMWGIFYEEINHAGDGGLYAELIRNRNFSESDIPEGTFYADGKVRTRNGHTENFDISNPLPGWSVRKAAGTSAFVEKITENPRNPECANQMKFTVNGGCARVINGGYWGISAKNQNYYGYIIAKSENITNIKLGLIHKDGSVIASSDICGITNEYKKFNFDFDVPESETDKNARFFIEVSGNGSLYIDFVTLFPEDTYAGRKFGFRRDIVEMLRGIKPGFVRFPGGCVVEGITLENAIHWKKTVGAIEDRPGHWDLWNYRCTDGLGMLEFCQLAEDLGADIMYVINCGMSCQARSSELANEEGIEYWLKNALDGIEYICGDVTTEWGAKRAADGHTEPFNLKYVEIGNENSGRDYDYRYKKFYAAIKERYPNLTLIADCYVENAPIDMVDDHYYTVPQTFPSMNERYSGNGPKIYVGEYACNSEVGYGNLLGAVSDATFMTHMENCCDRVEIASYAPLLCNDHDRRWPVNLINFDNNNIFGIPSYYVQRLFGNNTVERVVKNDNTVIKGALTNTYVTTGVCGNELVIKIAVFGNESVNAEFTCPEVKDGEYKVAVVSSESEKDTNSLLYPENVCETYSTVYADGGKINCTLNAWSFNVIRCTL